MGRRIFGIAIIALGHRAALAQPVPSGQEFQANVYTTGSQSRPRVAADGAGGFVIVWPGDALDGSYQGIFARRYAGGGAPLDAQEFQVNTYTTDDQSEAAVAMDVSGGFVVVWSSYSQDASGRGVFVRRYTSAGTPLDTPEFRVNTYTTGSQSRPSVAVDASGRFVVVWESEQQDGSDRGVFARRYDSAGGALDVAEFQVNAYATGGQIAPAVAADLSGGFVVAWVSDAQDGSGYGVFARRYDSAGGALDVTEFQVNTYTPLDQDSPAVAPDGSGGFVVAWTDASLDGSGPGIVARRYDSSGTPVDAQEIQVNAYTTGLQNAPSAAATGSGGFVVAWTSQGQDGFVDGAFARRFDAAGSPVDLQDFQANTYTAGTQRFPDVAVDGAGRFVVAWEGAYQDGFGYGVFGQRFDCDDADGDGVCDADDVVVTSPQEGALLDCSNPRVYRPAIAWSAGVYERFRVYLSPSAAFPKSSRVTSGDTLLSNTVWTPSAKKWRAACSKATAANQGNPVLHVRVLGKDVDARKTDPNRLTYSQTVQTEVAP